MKYTRDKLSAEPWVGRDVTETVQLRDKRYRTFKCFYLEIDSQ